MQSPAEPTSIKQLVIASNNIGKIIELRQVLQPLSIEVHVQHEFVHTEAKETANSFIENAFIKARHLASHCKIPTLADDSGLCVPALGLAPGICSARYAGTHGNSTANINKLFKAMTHYHGESRRAFFYCSLVLLRHEHDPVPLICQGQWWGTIAKEKHGDGGFGYDPVFLPDEHPLLSAAQLTPQEKNRLSHRGKAMQMLLSEL